MKEQKQYLSLLEQLKDYDEELAQGLAARAFQEQERQRLEVFSFYNIHAAFRLEKTRIKGSLFPFQGRSMVVWLFQYSIFAKLHLLQQNRICCRQECWVGWGMGEGGCERRGLGPRNDFITTCKAVTLCGGHRILAIFFPSKARGEPAETLTQ